MRLLNYKMFLESLNSNKYFLPTYNECRLICDSHDNFIFYETKHKEDGFDISIFNYRLASFQNFDNPVVDRPDIKAHEMRGITFVWNTDGTLFKRYLLLDKFFNLDQTPCSMYSVVRDFKIKNIYNKEDGSIASFIRLPNGKVLGRSKASFESDQAIEIQNIYNRDSNIKKFVDYCISKDIIPIFEYVSPNNRIVVPYANTELILLRLRDNNTGEYLDINNFSEHLDGISVASSLDGHTLDSIKDAVVKMEGKEGVIIQFDNGKMIKLKSPWYCALHGIYTTDLKRENTLIKFIIEETIDDVLAQLNDPLKIKEVEKITNIINRYIKNISDKTDELLSNFNGNVREFALKHSKDKLFHIAIGVINGKDKLFLIKEKILSDTKNLMSARKWIIDNS